ETAKRLEGIGADIMVQSPAAQMLITFSGSPMPIKIADKLAELKYVQAVAPVLLQFNSTGGVETVWGIDAKSFRDVSSGFVFLQGHDLQDPDDILVDDWQAKAKHIKVGDTYHLFNHEWRIAGVVEHGKGARLFVPLATLQDLVGAHDKASIFLVKCTHPDHTADVIAEIKELLPNHPVRPLKEFMTLMTSTNIPGLETFINVMIALAASKVLIVRALLTETTLLCVLGIAAGVGLSYLVRAGFLALFPTLSILITTEWVLRAGLIALVGAVLGASYPAWLASRKDPVEALSYD